MIVSEQQRDPSDDIQTTFVGRFDPLEVPIILELLREHGIFAMTKVSLEDAESETGYPFLNEGRGSLLVDRTRVDEARRIISEEVPRRIEELRAGLEEGFETAIPDAYVPLGWLEPEVAKELLHHLAEMTIGAVAEYPLDGPPPPYAREDGRVRVHVEEILVDEATEILENEVREALTARGVAFTEPLLGEDA